ncbi:MAG: type II toxin-antitoxin system PemK/MazF family toxin [Candidatus Eremiobacteraeota bacterium]|nr:type II toxin-antitoxin system PemK/MazF family toxin [Candidatus Eremiobacteraeota bacterium]MCW5871000.1 type II toxin-antitoxin system PemK/MazF family toxin [Candidatus Eremiobacteraeota bacterium]
MKRGEVWWVNFEPSVGGEAQKIRPAVIVSNDAANRHLNRLQVVPVTSNTSRLFAGEAYVTIKRKQCKAQANLLTTVSKLRVSSQMDSLSRADLGAVESAIQVQLGL